LRPNGEAVPVAGEGKGFAFSVRDVARPATGTRSISSMPRSGTPGKHLLRLIVGRKPLKQVRCSTLQRLKTYQRAHERGAPLQYMARCFCFFFGATWPGPTGQYQSPKRKRKLGYRGSGEPTNPVSRKFRGTSRQQNAKNTNGEADPMAPDQSPATYACCSFGGQTLAWRLCQARNRSYRPGRFHVHTSPSPAGGAPDVYAATARAQKLA